MLVALRPPVRLDTRRRLSPGEFYFLERRLTPRSVFMQIGGPDCDLALRVAGYVERVYAVDVCGRLLQRVLVPCNVRLVVCDGVRIPVPEASVHVAFSAGFIDGLDPDDAGRHLESVRRSLVPGGEYICVTDSPQTLRRRLLACGFSKAWCRLGAARIPWAAHALVPPKLLRISAIK